MNWNLLVAPFISRLWLKIGIYGQRPELLQRNTRNIAISFPRADGTLVGSSRHIAKKH